MELNHQRAYRNGMPSLGENLLTGQSLPVRDIERFIREVMADMPIARLASIGGYKGWHIRFEERFPNRVIGPGRELLLTVSGPGFEVRSEPIQHRDPRVAEALLARQVLGRLEDGGHGSPVRGQIFTRESKGHALLSLCASLDFERPRIEIVKGNPERLRQFISQCYLQLPGEVLQSSGFGYSIRESCQSASSKMLSNPTVKKNLSFRPMSDPSTVLVGAVLRAGLPKPEFLIHTTIEPVGVACVLTTPGKEPLRFLGHADSLNNAREVAASRAYEWIVHRLKALRREAAARNGGGAEH
jgi:hypothetical protein